MPRACLCTRTSTCTTALHYHTHATCHLPAAITHFVRIKQISPLRRANIWKAHSTPSGTCTRSSRHYLGLQVFPRLRIACTIMRFGLLPTMHTRCRGILVCMGLHTFASQRDTLHAPFGFVLRHDAFTDPPIAAWFAAQQALTHTSHLCRMFTLPHRTHTILTATVVRQQWQSLHRVKTLHLCTRTCCSLWQLTPRTHTHAAHAHASALCHLPFTPCFCMQHTLWLRFGSHLQLRAVWFTRTFTQPLATVTGVSNYVAVIVKLTVENCYC